MLFHVGGDGTRPTFFEMVAADHLPRSIKGALLYTLGIWAQRQPAVHRVIDYSDEAVALLMLLLEGHSLCFSSASFGESLYGLRREEGGDTAASSHENTGRSSPGLKWHRCISSLLLLVGAPYVKAKVQAVYLARSQPLLLQQALWNGDSSYPEEPEQREAAERGHPPVRSLLLRCYPYLDAASQSVDFAYALLYLLGSTPFYSLALHLQGLVVRRATMQELTNKAQSIAQQRQQQYRHLRGPPIVQMFQRTLLQAGFGALDYMQSSLVAAVFLFKIVEWWYQSAEPRVTAPAVYPPPPPPPSPKLAEGGLALPSDRRLCPLCCSVRTNPTMAATSGFVFCYPCIFNYVQQYGRCPVTLMPVSLESLRKLYYSA